MNKAISQFQRTSFHAEAKTEQKTTNGSANKKYNKSFSAEIALKQILFLYVSVDPKESYIHRNKKIIR